MNHMPRLNRRAFVIGSAALGSGLALGLDIPFGPTVVRAADGSPEINAWVVIQPDDTVVIRIARSEMGQGTLTGLAQLVAEELECDWSKVTTIEGLATGEVLHKVQLAWIANDVPQCGYCQSGMIMAVAALLKDNPKPTDQDIDDTITNICRCGTFKQVREAIHAASEA